ncbi:MAG: hypothetical protein JW909_03885 [Planctomycetes bacterium]|nr:hypothetical protein [Planctomycetota bacterium]
MSKVKKLTTAVLVVLLGAGGVAAQDTSTRGLARERLKDAKQDIERSSEEAKALSRHHTEVGRKFYEAYKYDLARVALKKAVELDPDNEEAQKLLNSTMELLGERAARIRGVLERLEREVTVREQESLLELRNHIQIARDYYGKALNPAAEDVADKTKDKILSMALHDLDVAWDHIDRARDILRWLPHDIDVSSYENEAKSVAESIKDARDEKKAALSSYSQSVAIAEAEDRKQLEREFEKQRINKLMDQAQMFESKRQFEMALRTAREVRKIDPTNADANAMVQSMRVKMQRQRDDKIQALDKEEKTNLGEFLTSSTIPYSKYLVYPDDWEEIRKRESVEMREADEPTWMKTIRRELDKNVSFEFVETPLTEAVQFLQALTKVNIIFDPKALEEIGGDMEITLRVSEMPLHLALKWILRLASLDYTIKNEAVFISTPRNLAGEVELRVYDVRDLTTSITDFSAPELIMGGGDASGMGGMGGGMGGGLISLDGGGSSVVETATLADLITRHIQPQSWGDEMGTSIEDRGGKLVVMQRPEIHGLIAQLLRSFRESQTLQVLVDARFIEVRNSFLEDIGVAWTDIPAGDPSYPANGGGGPQEFTGLSGEHPIFLDSNYTGQPYSTLGMYDLEWNASAGIMQEIGAKTTFKSDRMEPYGTRLGTVTPWGQVFGGGAHFAFRYAEQNGFQAQAILNALKREEKGDLLMSPRVTMYNNQRAYVLFARQRGYVADYDISGGVYDPVIRTILTGTILDVKPTVSHDRRYITLEMRPGTADRLDLSRTAIIGGYVNLPIQLPRLQLRSVRTTMTLPDGGTMLLSGLMTETKHHSHSGIPVLSDLPIIGRLFGSDLKQDERMNLLIMVSVRLILFTEEERKL